MWRPPAGGFVKINTHGAAKGNTRRAEAGGLIRDSQGEWIGGFHRHIGITTNTLTELWAVRNGLRLDKVAISLLQQEFLPARPYFNLICARRFLLSTFQSASIRHVHCEGNKCANFSQLLDFVYIFYPPPELGQLLDLDSRGVGSMRQFVTNSDVLVIQFMHHFNPKMNCVLFFLH